MPPFFEHALRITWLVLLAYWFWAARSTKIAERQETPLKRVFAYWMPLLVAVLLLGPGPWFSHSLLREQFVPTPLSFIRSVSRSPSSALHWPSILGGYSARTGVPQCNSNRITS